MSFQSLSLKKPVEITEGKSEISVETPRRNSTELQAAWRCISIMMIERQTRSKLQLTIFCLCLHILMCSMKGSEEINSEFSLVLNGCHSKSTRVARFQGRDRHCEKISAAVPPLGQRAGKGTLPWFAWFCWFDWLTLTHVPMSQGMVGFSWQFWFQRKAVILEPAFS